MTREEKSQVIQDLTVTLARTNTIYLADISGLDALATSNLRRACFKANVQLAVVKNTLLSKAMEASDKEFGELQDILKKTHCYQKQWKLLTRSLENYRIY